MKHIGPILNIVLTRKITLGFLITLIIPSLAGSFFVLYRVTQKREIFKQLHNQLIFCIFMVYFIQTILDLPLTITFLHRGVVAIPNYSFCAYWFILMSALNMCTMHLNAYLSVERYLLVFHHKFIFKYKILTHYMPMFFILINSAVFTFCVVIFYPCQNEFNYDAILCGTSCAVLDPIFGVFLWVNSFVAPLLIIILSNGFLLLKVICQKRRMLQKNIWHRNKKMVLQLISVTGMLYISWLPLTTATVINIAHPTQLLSELHLNWYLIGLIYIPVLSSPITTSIAILELREDLRAWFNRRRPFFRGVQIHAIIPTGTQ
ncbi:unnamed protein product [Adineta ricciae]|uniref:G-protein coupled receptors family 1 profile domain-containing protein n=1 Tax=Adineta ricciae TaxID=249248 RepID=A0A815VPD2_ADIRI|nr:unnamed protein product [Adineta ricciae]CAF1538375.1 unnamed protein product [Adineta ricciae]